jgi:NAD-dependent dihydropyrimidine dehydrogenase PreA subunit
VTFVITQPCIDVKDQSCVDVCPVDCIHFDEDTDRLLYIDPVECIDCGACEPVCPETAIFAEGDVPGDQQHFTEINALWYQDADAARAQVEGAPAEPAAAPAESGEQAAPAAAEAAPSETEEAPAETAPVLAATYAQVEAPPEDAPEGIVVPSYSQPSPAGLVALAGFAASFFVMWVFPGPRALSIGGVGLHAGVLLAVGPAAIFLLLFVRSQAEVFAAVAATHDRELEAWRQVRSDWRRSEESRRFALTSTVQRIAEDRFKYPNDAFPDYQTHVNLPEPSMAISFGGGGGQQLYPDILVVEHPGNYPVLVAQVETRETLTREQAERVWSRLETAEAPLDVYVPAGLAVRAKDFARAAGIKHVRFRTWRHSPNGVVIREV